MLLEFLVNFNFFNLFQKFGTLPELEQQLTDVLQVSSVKLIEEEMNENYRCTFDKSKRFSCPRCRKVQSETHNEICKRCYDVLNVLKNNKTAVVN